MVGRRQPRTDRAAAEWKERVDGGSVRAQPAATRAVLAVPVQTQRQAGFKWLGDLVERAEGQEVELTSLGARDC